VKPKIYFYKKMFLKNIKIEKTLDLACAPWAVEPACWPDCLATPLVLPCRLGQACALAELGLPRLLAGLDTSRPSRGQRARAWAPPLTGAARLAPPSVALPGDESVRVPRAAAAAHCRAGRCVQHPPLRRIDLHGERKTETEQDKNRGRKYKNTSRPLKPNYSFNTQRFAARTEP
jgi:hypothetical protein